MSGSSTSGTERTSVDKIGDCANCIANVLKFDDWVIDESTGRIWHYECAPDPEEDGLREERSVDTGTHHFGGDSA